MKKYKVEFWYGTDLRYTNTVAALDEVGAMAITVNRMDDLYHWCDNKGFEIRVRLA